MNNLVIETCEVWECGKPVYERVMLFTVRCPEHGEPMNLCIAHYNEWVNARLLCGMPDGVE